MARTFPRVRRGRAMAAAFVALAGAAVLAAFLSPGAAPRRDAAALRLSIMRAMADGDAGMRFVASRGRPAPASPAPARALAATSGGSLTFGQPTIAGVNGFGFEADLRLDPTNPNTIYTSVPGTGGANTSWIWRSLDGGRTFKWVPATTPATATAEGKVDAPCVGGGDTEIAVDPGGRLYFNDLSLANFSTARSDDHGKTLTCSTAGVPDAGVDRQWYALDGDPTAGGSLYLTNDEVGNGAVQCGNTIQNNTLVMYRSPAAGAGPSAGVEFGPPNHITLPGGCDEGIMGPDEVSPVPTATGIGATLATPVRHVYVVHDDGSLSKIRIARCFPVAFGAPLPNVSDPSGLNCVDLPVADLGTAGSVRTGGNFPALAIDRAGNLYAVWEQAPVDASGKVGDSSLMYAYSTDEGNTWSAPVQIPTPGLNNNVYAWAAAGDDGRVDVAWYGTPAHADPSSAQCPNGGPDSAAGSWSLYLTQTQNGRSSSVTFTSPQLAGEHPVRRGGLQTIIGMQCADDPTTGHTVRALGDFLQLRIGSKGEAQISYADSTNVDGQIYGSHAMYVRQVGGPGVYKGKSPSGDPVQLNSVSDPAGDATFDAAGQVSADMPNLDILGSSLSFPKANDCHPKGAACLRVTMKVANMSTAAPVSPDTDGDIVWLTQWLDPSDPACASPAPSCQNGGLNFFVYGESTSGGAVQCWTGQNALEQNTGGIALTYPGSTQIAAPGACNVQTGANGSITIDVPRSLVSLDPGVAPFSSKLYSVTASTMTLAQPANTVPWSSGVGGIFFNVVDQARSYDAKP
jgi:hypothetical protein